MSKTNKAMAKKAGFTLAVMALGLIALNTMAKRSQVAGKARNIIFNGV